MRSPARYNNFQSGIINKKISPCKYNDEPFFMVQDQESQSYQFFNSYEFWDYLTIYHLEQVENISDGREKLVYLKRLPSHYEITKNRFFKKFLTEEKVSKESCSEFIEWANLAKGEIIAAIEDLKRYLNEKNNPPDSQSEDIKAESITIQLPETPLKCLFNNATIYDKIITLMTDKGLIICNQHALIWKGFKNNRKIDLIAFCEVLYSKNLLNQRVDNFDTLIPILSGTFLGFTISKKGFGNKNSNNLQAPFKELLNSF